MLNRYYADLHIHIGRTDSGKPVKITGARSLTLKNILETAANVKGMNMIGVIDCHVPEIIAELERLIAEGEVFEHEEGGVWFKHICLILGSEIEVYDESCRGPIHVLAFMPKLEKMKQFSHYLAERMKNITLSSQRIYETGKNLQRKVKELGGLFIPAHVFTPHKSLYGKGVCSTLTEVLDPFLIDGIELGLSSDTHMAETIQELEKYTFLSNSDAHSLEKIGREYQIVQMAKPTFKELELALLEKDGRKVIANFGLNPKLGKYYQTTCEKCGAGFNDISTLECPFCGSRRFVKGVRDRLFELSESGKQKRRARPPYVHQVPLEFLPSLGKKTLEKLRDHFGTDMAILHEVSETQLKQVVKPELATMILNARAGKLLIQTGGGGVYGKIKNS
ncbi:endonuclease Q family protein [Fictibacillus sp. Mic-4]|uniref:endonuclease Q family protein n=1 Tax=Fictibacillus sp. Mic-4 TaxID=3132826 RepID=UPI003CF71E0B